MSATYSVGKQGRRYPYYVSQALLQNEKERAGSIARVPAEEIERLVGNALGASKGEASTGRVVTTGRPALSQSSGRHSPKVTNGGGESTPRGVRLTTAPVFTIE
jgi:hypothetical protein